MTTATEQRNCADCGKPFTALTFAVLGVAITANRCEACDAQAQTLWDKRKAEQDAMSDRPRTRAERFQHIATESGFRRFLDYDAEKGRILPRSAEGYIFVGHSGMGKTFQAVEVMRQAYEAGKSVHLIDSVAFGLAVGTTDAESRKQELARCVEADWLLFDDLAKGAITPRVAEGLFHVADKRENWQRPIVWTTQATEKEIRERIGAEYADAFVNRLKRTCVQVVFQ